MNEIPLAEKKKVESNKVHSDLTMKLAIVLIFKPQSRLQSIFNMGQ